MDGQVVGGWKARRGRGWVALSAVVVAAAVAAVAAWSASGSLAASRSLASRSLASRSLAKAGQVDSAGRPAHWAPVLFRRARLSVPGQWQVETSSQVWCEPRATGMIFAGVGPKLPRDAGCGLTASYAWIVPAGHLPAGIGERKPTKLINGIPVYRRPAGHHSVLYLVPKLRVLVGAHGPLARRVLATLHWSPLAVVLGTGRPAPVPSHWVWHRFGEVRFAVPGTWHHSREKQWATCGTGLWPGQLLLIDAIKPPLPLPCPARLPLASVIAAQPGLTVVTGKYAARSVGESFTRCQLRDGARICLAAVTGQGGFFSGVLIFAVSRPHHHPAAYFVLGLPGSGDRARAVFDSVALR